MPAVIGDELPVLLCRRGPALLADADSVHRGNMRLMSMIECDVFPETTLLSHAKCTFAECFHPRASRSFVEVLIIEGFCCPFFRHHLRAIIRICLADAPKDQNPKVKLAVRARTLSDTAWLQPEEQSSRRRLENASQY
jgi:hypothetical protein